PVQGGKGALPADQVEVGDHVVVGGEVETFLHFLGLGGGDLERLGERAVEQCRCRAALALGVEEIEPDGGVLIGRAHQRASGYWTANTSHSFSPAGRRTALTSPTAAPRSARAIGALQPMRPAAASCSSSPTSVSVRSLSSSSTIVTVAPNHTRVRSGACAGSTTLAAFIRRARWASSRSISRMRFRP